MCSYAAASRPFGSSQCLIAPGNLSAALRAALGCIPFLLLFCAVQSPAIILWNDLGATLAHETGAGTDILGGALKRDESSSGTLYFKFHVDPLSDSSTEE